MDYYHQIKKIRNQKRSEYLKYADENKIPVNKLFENDKESDVLICGMTNKKELDELNLIEFIKELNRQYFNGELDDIDIVDTHENQAKLI